jgi:GH15 family glucan-1,4-alpha-glucosidase
MDGTIDWFCHPHFDSPSVFGTLLAPEAGSFSIQPNEAFRSHQTYVPRTNVLVTRFHGWDSTADLVDFMPIADGKRHRIVRGLKVLRGSMDFVLACSPRPGYGQACTAERVASGAHFTSGDHEHWLHSDVEVDVAKGSARATFRLAAGESAWFHFADDDEVPPRPELLQEETEEYWRQWLRSCTYRGRWQHDVERSALVLKMLTFEPTGAMVAAATTSLPPQPGSVRTWDYRYTWLRDSSFVLYALLRIGFKQEARRFMDWLIARCRDGPALHPLYTIHGGHVPEERELAWDSSSPVRVGNGARDHLQLDTYGAILDAAYLFNKYGMPLSAELWDQLRGLLDWLEANWRKPDQSIWESRGRPRRFTFSRVMCWVAFDRGIRLAERRSFPAPLERWRKARDELRAWVLETCYDEGLRSFVQAPSSRVPDASVLLVPLTFFGSPMDTFVASTVDTIHRTLGPDGLVRRMPNESPADTFPDQDRAFAVCSFWLVEAMTRQGRLQEAERTFEALRRHANPLGLYSEQIGDYGLARGNFPQALTHLSLISAAFNLDRAMREDGGHGARTTGHSGTAWRAFVEPKAQEIA